MDIKGRMGGAGSASSGEAWCEMMREQYQLALEEFSNQKIYRNCALTHLKLYKQILGETHHVGQFSLSMLPADKLWRHSRIRPITTAVWCCRPATTPIDD